MHPLLKELAGGDRRSTGRSDEVARRICHSPRLFAVLVNGMTVADPVLRMRAADAVEKASRTSPLLLQPHKRRFLNEIAAVQQQEVRWHLAQIVPRLRLTARERRATLALLRRLLGDQSRIVQVNAMQALADLALQDVGLRRSVSQLLRSRMAKGGPAVNARGRKLLSMLRRDAIQQRPS